MFMMMFVGKVAGGNASAAQRNAREILEEDGFKVGRNIEVSYLGQYVDGRNTISHFDFRAPVCFKGQE